MGSTTSLGGGDASDEYKVYLIVLETMKGFNNED